MLFADVAELADALDLGSSVTDVGVQVPSSAPIKAITSVIAFFILYKKHSLFNKCLTLHCHLIHCKIFQH